MSDPSEKQPEDTITTTQPEDIITTTDNDDVNVDENRIYSISSLCMNCHDTGKTTYYLTSIAHFREIIISHFSCPHCGFKDTGVQFGGSIQPLGVRIACKVGTKDVGVFITY